MCDSGKGLVIDLTESDGDDVVLTEMTQEKSKDSEKNRSSCGSIATKRKALPPTRPLSSKAKCTRDNDRNISNNIKKPDEVSGNEKNSDEKVIVPELRGDYMQEVPEEELLALDSSFADRMFERVSKKLQPRASGDFRTKVCISPLVIQDMADSAMQQLVKSQQPNIGFFFKQQDGNFKKKKGYAEIFFETNKEMYTMLHHLCRVNFEEKRIKITVSIHEVETKRLLAEGSFVLRRMRLDNITKLLQNIKENDDRPFDNDCFLSVSEVPEGVSLSKLQCFFPFLPKFTTNGCQPIKSMPGFKGPVQACYKDLAQVKSISDIFVDFTVNGHTLTVQRCNPNQVSAPVVASETSCISSQFLENCVKSSMAEEGEASAKTTEGFRIKVCITPVTNKDLKDSAMKQLIKSQEPNIRKVIPSGPGPRGGAVKKHNGKFFRNFNTRRKKSLCYGYVEIFFEKDKYLYTLLDNLCQVNFVEKRIKITVSILNASNNKLRDEGSFVLRRNFLEKVEELLQDMKENKKGPIYKDCFLLVPAVPDVVSFSNLRLFFPFLPTLITTDCQPIDSLPGFKGPIQVCYRDFAQVKGVRDIFVDFTVNGHTLTVQRRSSRRLKSTETSAGEKVVSNESEKSTGVDSKEGLQRTSASVEDVQIAEKAKKQKGKSEIDGNRISSLAHDLCSDIGDSLNKLQQM